MSLQATDSGQYEAGIKIKYAFNNEQEYVCSTFVTVEEADVVVIEPTPPEFIIDEEIFPLPMFVED